MSTRHKRRAILGDEPAAQPAPDKLIRFGSPSRPADRCTYTNSPAEFRQCFGCSYARGAQGLGMRCGHRFGLDPTLIDGRPTQLQGDDIVDL